MFDELLKVKVGDIIVTKQNRVPVLIVVSVGSQLVSCQDAEGNRSLVFLSDVVILRSI